MTDLIEAFAGYDVRSADIEKTKIWYKVACNAGSFVVAASNEGAIHAELTAGLEVPAAYRYTKAEPLEAKSLGNVLGLPEVDPSTIVAELLDVTLANHFDQIGLPTVTYSGISTPQA